MLAAGSQDSTGLYGTLESLESEAEGDSVDGNSARSGETNIQRLCTGDMHGCVSAATTACICSMSLGDANLTREELFVT